MNIHKYIQYYCSDLFSAIIILKIFPSQNCEVKPADLTWLIWNFNTGPGVHREYESVKPVSNERLDVFNGSVAALALCLSPVLSSRPADSQCRWSGGQGVRSRHRGSGGPLQPLSGPEHHMQRHRGVNSFTAFQKWQTTRVYNTYWWLF